MALLAYLGERRSSRPAHLSEPGPSPDELTQILKIASRVPDHKKLVPWRFVVFQGEARAAFGDVLAATLQSETDEPVSDVRLETERTRFLRAPLVVAVVSSIKDVPTVPEQEQILSAGAATFALCMAANGHGYGTAWITEWYSYSPGIAAALHLGSAERVAGVVYIGTALETQADRDRPNLADIVSHWQAH